MTGLVGPQPIRKATAVHSTEQIQQDMFLRNENYAAKDGCKAMSSSATLSQVRSSQVRIFV